MPKRPPFRGEGTYDPWKCYYGTTDGCSICGYCRGDIADAGPNNGMGSIFKQERRECGHSIKGSALCACRKVRAPLTEAEAWQLLSRSQ